MLILMGVHQLPQLGNYWSSDPILRVTAISSVMTKLRYKKIVENLHCNDNSTCVKKGKPGYDKLHKIRPVIRAISNKICKVYKPSSVSAVDELMVAFKGRSTLKQYMPMKPVKRGYKVWCLADTSTGFIINFDIYTGKRDTNDTSKFTLGEEVALTLTKAIDGSKRLVAFDNYFTTVRIMEELQSHGLYGIGTVRPNRKDLPDMLKKNSKLSRGEFEFAVRSCIAAVKWQDYIEVLKPAMRSISIMPEAAQLPSVNHLTKNKANDLKNFTSYIENESEAVKEFYSKVVRGNANYTEDKVLYYEETFH
ncbi:piggyBac transposable element-derived protein 4-like [Schistocerca serialis cubense]|uniref:piggyBac transposable element-derived protein 4-like n=1 Tax=Schistocerca serialis cubense TaxID=2023355 RepID=UPI00214E9E9D|nr:piggyBac transposable element-derived protein 4-like [Schistocerca serialis cubense]